MRGPRPARRSALVLALLVAGCTSPVRVVQLESFEHPVRGIRYVLKRPSYGLGLQLVGVAADRCRFDVAVVTRLTERRFFEVRRPAWYALPLHAFSDSALSIRLDGEGALTSASLTETDRTLEFVKAAAELASRLVRTARAVDDADCGALLPPATLAGWRVYLDEKQRLEAELAELAAARGALLAELAEAKTPSHKARLESVEALEQRARLAAKRVREHYLPVADRDYQLRIGERVISGSGGSEAPIRVALAPLANPVRCGLRARLASVCASGR